MQFSSNSLMKIQKKKKKITNISHLFSSIFICPVWKRKFRPIRHRPIRYRSKIDPGAYSLKQKKLDTLLTYSQRYYYSIDYENEPLRQGLAKTDAKCVLDLYARYFHTIFQDLDEIQKKNYKH